MEQCTVHSLARYDAACHAIAAAHAVDEVKEIRDRAVAIKAYARQANNKDLEIKASELRFRAERRIGVLINEMDRLGLIAKGGQPYQRSGSTGSVLDPVETLAEKGIDKHLADRARKYASVPERRFEAMMAERRDRIEQDSARVTINLFDEDEKKRRRAERELELAKRQCALPNKRYNVIYADPEWRFEPWSRETGLDLAADNHYPTSPLEIIKARDVASIAADDLALFLWVPQPMLPQGLDVLETWGAIYKTHWIWAKDRIGLGYWNRNKHEVLLLGTRGNIPCPAPGEQWDSLMEAPRKGHSEKPEIFLEMVEAYFPNLPKIELNRRGPPRRGWAAWGNEVETRAAAC